MEDTNATLARLQELIAAAAAPPPVPGGRMRRAVRRLLLGAGRPRAVHQHAVNEALVAMLLDLSRREERLAAEFARAVEEISALRVSLEQISRRGDELRGQTEQLLGGADDLRSELARLASSVPGDGPLYGPDTLPLEIFEADKVGRVVGFHDSQVRDDENLYVGFENYFRGTEEQIRQRQGAYLPLLEGREPVLDIGCGRGEMLELLRDRGVQARGVDLDAAMVRRCRAKALDVVAGDGVHELTSARDSSLGAIFAAQVIEHLSYDDLMKLLRGARDKLRPGGVLVMESVNPHVPQALKHFWIDPTHRHPLFPETVIALCRLTGFASAYIFYPLGSGDPNRDRVEQFDYAVLAETSRA